MAIKRFASGVNLGLHSTPTVPWPEAVTQVFKAGAPLVVVANRASEPANGAAIAAKNLIGFAEHDATGRTDFADAIVPALPSLLFDASVDGAQAAGNAPGTGTVLLAQLGAIFGLQKDGASGLWYVDVSGAGTHVVVVELIDAIGTVQGRVRCMPLLSATIFGQ